MPLLTRATVIGLGVGEQHAKAWARCRGARLVGVCDHDRKKALRVSRELKTRTFKNLQEIIKDSAVDAVSIATFDGEHARQVVEAMLAGKHVFVEKPLCRNHKELKRIRSAWADKKPALMANLVLRAAPLYRRIQKMIGAGELGKIYAMDGDYFYGRVHKITSGWRSKDKGYSVMAGGGVHLLDLILGFAGETPNWVTATGNRICTRGSRFQRKDFVSAVFEFPLGLVARITANFGCVHKHQHTLRIFGTRGTVIVDDEGARWHRSRRPESRPTPLLWKRLPASKGELVSDFASLIQGGARRQKACGGKGILFGDCTDCGGSCSKNRASGKGEVVADKKKSQEIPFGRPWIGPEEKTAVLSVLDSPILTHGPKGKEFEKGFEKMMGGGHAISTSSCMASLHLAALDLKLGQGDEVLVPAMTHVATVHAVELTGAKPVFVDCETTTGNMDPVLLEKAITPKTKAVFVVHFAGIPADMEAILKITGKNNLPVVEDCALAVGARVGGAHVGLLGILGCYSFYPVKHITTGEGGMLVSTDETRLNRIAKFRAFNVDRTHTERSIPGFYEVTGVGLNYRMSELQAALGCAQLNRVAEILKRRAKNFAILKSGLEKFGGIKLLDSSDPERTSSHYCAVVLLQGRVRERRNEMVALLGGQGIGTSIYYPHPVPRFQYYAQKYGYQKGQCPGAEAIADESVALPVGPHLDESAMAAIIQGMQEALKKIS